MPAERRRPPPPPPQAPPAPAPSRPILPRTDFLLAGILGAGVLILIVAVIIFAGGRGSSTPATNTARPASSLASGQASSVNPGDRQAIETLARRSIEVLPQGQWPSLYDSYTRPFQQRCSRDAFALAGQTAEQQLGSDLSRLQFKRIEQLSISGDSATTTIVGQLQGGSEYSLQGAFQRENGVWKFAPAPGTQGCNAFNRISG